MKDSSFTLTPEQEIAITHPGTLMVSAGAGSGKTRVLAYRVAHLINSGASEPFNILAVTFSVRAARELRERLADLVAPESVRLMAVCTLHALGLRMLRESGDMLGYVLDERRRNPRVITPAESQALIAVSMKECVASGGGTSQATVLERLGVENVVNLVNEAKANGISPDAFAQGHHDAIRDVVAGCYRVYQAKLKAPNMVDFGDLILQPLQLLKVPAALAFYQSRWQHILVDEFQDTSRPQYEILRLIAGLRTKLTVIGDTNQSIYTFRGAMGGEGFEQFMRDFPSARIVSLSHNFRSSANIVAVGDALLQGVKSQQHALKPCGPPVALLRVSSEHEEAVIIAHELLRATHAGFAHYDECAVLCRTNAQIPSIENALLHASVPYNVVGRGGFFDHSEIRQLLAYLSLSQDVIGDNYALRIIINVPPRGLGPAELAELKGDAPEITAQLLLDAGGVAGLKPRIRSSVKLLLDALQQLQVMRDAPPAHLLEHMLSEDGLGLQRHFMSQPNAAERLERVRELWHMADVFSKVSEFLDEVDTMAGQDPLSTAGSERVQVMTLHDAKGLEFKLVFVAGLEEGRIPHYYGQSSRRGLEEERRLCYVGFTRATDVLCLTYARERNGKRSQPSRFLQGLPSEIIIRHPPIWAKLETTA